MKILVIESSPHKHGSSNLLADHFIPVADQACIDLIYEQKDGEEFRL